MFNLALMNKLMRIECVIECHSSASKSPWHDYVIHELKTKKKKVKTKENKTPTPRQDVTDTLFKADH